MTTRKLMQHTSLDWLMAKRELYMLYSTAPPLSTRLTTTLTEKYGGLKKSWFGRAISFGVSGLRFLVKEMGYIDGTHQYNMPEQGKMVQVTKFTLTGCVDCGVVKTMPSDLPEVTQAGYMYGGLAVRMWKNEDGKHTMILVKGQIERVFLSCQPWDKLFSPDGIAAILNFVDRIKANQEVSNVPIT